ncbi:MAG: 50S ribosomal protein L32 [Eubacteriaceae bacterium]|nr:50S ribosomal protein L32 [Eubacteriaceae bacterium]MBR5996223.1 50S ribosomal protein L32 [Eubacteriaceae bacterium]
MGVPKHRQSKSKKNKRRANFKVAMPGLSKCPECGELMQPHRVCPNCGKYNGRVVVEA